jgi:hypothetical protein
MDHACISAWVLSVDRAAARNKAKAENAKAPNAAIAGKKTGHDEAAAAAATQQQQQTTTRIRNQLSTNVMKNALANSPTLRAHNAEIDDPYSALFCYIMANMGSRYQAVPPGSAQFYNDNKAYTLHACTFQWVDGERRDILFLRCKIAHYSAPHPATAPAGENATVTRKIDMTKNLFLVKNVDTQGNYVANYFTNFKMSTLKVSPKLLFYTRN